MATWVDCTAGPNGYGGWQADMGVYTGPWPIQAPTTADGVDFTFAALQFLVGLPNPVDTTDVTIAFDDSYNTPLWDAYVLDVSLTPHYTVNGFGGNPGPSPGDLPPSGVHLYVAAGSLPTHAPEFYVPASYVSTGTAPEPPGHWSAWFSGYAESVTGQAPTDGTNWYSAGTTFTDTESVASTGGNITTLGNTAAGVIAAAGTAASGALIGVIAEAAGDKLNATAFTAAETKAVVQGSQDTFRFEAVTTNPSPDLSGLTPGVDYDTPPFGAVAWEYESPDPAVFGWGDLHTEQSGKVGGTPTGTGTSVFPLSHSLRYELLTAPVTVGHVGLVAGSTITNVTVASDDPTPASGHYGAATTIAVPVGADASTELVISVAPEFLYSGMDATAQPDIAADGTYDWVMQNQVVGVDYDFTTSRWRYWIPTPATPGVKWHTVGGHWATVGGATMRILTPLPAGNTWVDVADGPG